MLVFLIVISWQCGVMIVWFDLAQHKADKCPNRKVNCRNPGCYKKVILSEADKHELHECK